MHVWGYAGLCLAHFVRIGYGMYGMNAIIDSAFAVAERDFNLGFVNDGIPVCRAILGALT